MNELVERIAFAIQDDGMTRLEAQRIVGRVLAALRDGDVVGETLVVCTTEAASAERERSGLDDWPREPSGATLLSAGSGVSPVDS